MTLLMFDFPSPSPLGKNIREKISAEEGKVFVKTFPDGESFLRVENSVKGRDSIINATLFHPNNWALDLLFLADTLKAQGAKRVGLLAPYLSYMRQDKVFHPGEALTSKTFANLLSSYFDYLITVDPHLHRYSCLEEIYSIPTRVAHAAPLLAQWIHENVQNPFLIGPDSESLQWVQDIAGNSPFLVLTKVRHDDGYVEITWPSLETLGTKTPVLIDDIISSGGTLLQAVEHLKGLNSLSPVCVIIHPLFEENSYQKLQAAGVQKIATCNSIPHPSNQIDLTPLLAQAIRSLSLP